VFHTNKNDKASATDGLATRARGASTTAAQSAQVAAQAAQSAAQSAQAAAQVAAQGVSKTVKQQVHTARGWAAPRLENAADYCTATAAPRVSSAIRATARQVSPEDTKAGKSRMRPGLSWPFLVLAALAAAGAAAAVVVARQRYKAAMDADTEPDADPDESATRAAGPDGGALNQDTTAKESVSPQETSADPSMNGQVSTPGR
jgi:hypothetical protein